MCGDDGETGLSGEHRPAQSGLPVARNVCHETGDKTGILCADGEHPGEVAGLGEVEVGDEMRAACADAAVVVDVRSPDESVPLHEESADLAAVDGGALGGDFVEVAFSDIGLVLQNGGDGQRVDIGAHEGCGNRDLADELVPFVAANEEGAAGRIEGEGGAAVVVVVQRISRQAEGAEVCKLRRTDEARGVGRFGGDRCRCGLLAGIAGGIAGGDAVGIGGRGRKIAFGEGVVRDMGDKDAVAIDGVVGHSIGVGRLRPIEDCRGRGG
ncbi:MAG TPA: hypothetical protein VK178_09065 [Opitutaceae bacterium]|nr:hypothetical protein [Opitutaceae bacterium]